jgi:hypothetical protein
MGELIRMPLLDVLADAEEPERDLLRHVIRSFRCRGDAEQAAGLVARHLAEPELVVVCTRRGRFRGRYDLAVCADDADRARAVLELADRWRCGARAAGAGAPSAPPPRGPSAGP